MLYQISKASKYYGADTVFEDINFEIKGNEKIALVGRNVLAILHRKYLNMMSGL